jgi:ArsR family transcriptional regulator
MEDSFHEAAGLLKALSHPLRLEIVCGIRHKPCTQTYISEVLGVPQSTVAQHLRVLRTTGIVKSERRGLEVMLSLADPRVGRILDTLCARKAGHSKSRYTWSELADLEKNRKVS